MTRRRDNPFSHRNSPYEHPSRSLLRRLRGRLSLLALALLVLVLGGAWRQGTALVSEGQLHSTHAFLANDCAACHAPHSTDAAAGAAAHGADALTANCMHCHLDMNAQPHGNLALITRVTAAKAAGGAAPVRSGFTAWANSLPGGRAHPEAHAAIACAVCHQDHRGQDARQIVLSEATCQACHRSTFASFADGHPAFTEPAARPTRQVKFDHVLHYDGGFAKQTKAAVACSACHEQPTSAAVPVPRLKPAETMCLGCHQGDVAPTDALLLTSNGDEPSAFARLAGLLPRVRGGAATGRAPATVAELAAVVGPADRALVAGITDGLLAKARTDAEIKTDPATLPPGAWAVSNPEGEEHVQLAYRTIGHRDPQVVGWLLWLQARDREARQALHGEELAGWSKAAGEFVLDLGAATAPGTRPSRCALCHFVGADERAGVAVDFRKPTREAHFTRTYSHFVHASQAERQGAVIDCRACHVPAADGAGAVHDARWTALHAERRPQDWRAIPIGDCRTCHNDTTVRQDCATCHQYHQADPR